MTPKEQNKILDDKIESNNNQYKIDRLNAEISAFSSGDLNKYEFLMRKDLKYKPNALDKARFEFSPLGKTFSTGLDKTAQDYQEEGVIRLLKDIRDGLRGGVNRLDDYRPDNNDYRPDNNDDNNDDTPDNNDDRPDNNDDRTDNNDDNNDDQKVLDYVLKKHINDNNDDNDDNDDNNDNNDDDNNNNNNNSVFLNNLNNLNNEISNVKSDGDYYTKVISYQKETIKKLEKEITDRKNLTKDIIDGTSKTINEIKKNV